MTSQPGRWWFPFLFYYDWQSSEDYLPHIRSTPSLSRSSISVETQFFWYVRVKISKKSVKSLLVKNHKLELNFSWYFSSVKSLLVENPKLELNFSWYFSLFSVKPLRDKQERKFHTDRGLRTLCNKIRTLWKNVPPKDRTSWITYLLNNVQNNPVEI